MRLEVDSPRPNAGGIAAARASLPGGQPLPGQGTQPGHIPVYGSLPSELILAEHIGASLRRYLQQRELTEYQIFFSGDPLLREIDEYLDQLGEGDADAVDADPTDGAADGNGADHHKVPDPAAPKPPALRWDSHPSLLPGGEQPAAVHVERELLFPAGFLWLRKFQVVIARWHYFDVYRTHWVPLWLCAAASPAHYHRLRETLVALTRERSEGQWQIVGGPTYGGDLVARDPNSTWEDLILPSSLRQRLEGEVSGFFSEKARGLYQQLNVPYRRGVLLHGPPGNGKTSIIRVIGAVNPSIPVLVLRPAANFDDDDFHAVTARWIEQAPSILVIEDLDWLLPRLSVSTFLNVLDGIDSGRHGGLLLVATTNHVERLDPAVNNRPGRFDVVIEVPSPSAPMRLEFLQRKLTDASPAVAQKVADQTEGLSFAHLREIVHLSGLIAISDNRQTRSEPDIFRATSLVMQSYEEAKRGFPEQVGPFGLAQLRGTKKGEGDDIPY